MKNNLIDYFFDSKEEYEVHKPYIAMVGVALVINLIMTILF